MSLPDIRKERNNYKHYPITENDHTLSAYQSADSDAFGIPASPYSARERERRTRSERYDRLHTFMNAALWGIYIFAIGGAAFNAVFKKSTYEITVNHGRFAARPAQSSVEYVPEGSVTPYKPLEEGETHTQVALNEFRMTDTLTKNDLGKGTLAYISGSAAPADVQQSETVKISDQMNGFYALFKEDLRLNADAAAALNEMMEAYGNLSGYGDFVVYGTTDTYTSEGSCCPKFFPESLTGYTVDLAVSMGGLLPYDGEDNQGWVVQHCAEYGFVVRYPKGKENITGEEYTPWHLRYVGKAHAAVMAKNNLCLEEYLTYVKQFTYDHPLGVAVGGTEYRIYYTPAAEEGDTQVQRYLDGGYEVSGNNKDGFIVTVWKNN